MGIAYQRGMLLYGQKRYTMAADEFRKELAENPNSVFAMSMLALSLNYDGKPEKALVLAQEAIAADPEVAFAHYVLACVMIGNGPWEKPSFSRAVQYWGRTLPYRRRLRKATRPAMEAIRLSPHNADFLALMSAIELDLRRPGLCLQWAEKGLAARPDHVRSTNLRARALAKLGRAGEARTTFQGALALDPDSASTHAHGGWTHLQLGEPEKALEHFRESVRLNPDDDATHRGLKAAAAARTRRKYGGIGVVIYLIFALLRAASNITPEKEKPAINPSPVVPGGPGAAGASQCYSGVKVASAYIAFGDRTPRYAFVPGLGLPILQSHDNNSVTGKDAG